MVRPFSVGSLVVRSLADPDPRRTNCGGRPHEGEAAREVQGGVLTRSGVGWALAALGWILLALIAWDYMRVSQLYRPAAERWQSDSRLLAQPAQGSGSVFFQSELDFARLTTTPVSPANAQELHALALSLLHYSPEPRVVEPLIASAVLLGKIDEASAYLAQYRRAFDGDMWRQLLERNPGWAAYAQPS